MHSSDYVLEGTPIITTEHFKSGIIQSDVSTIPKVSEEDYKRLKGYAIETGDIVFSRVGSIDINTLVTERENGWLFSGRVIRVRLNSNYHSGYFHYLLSTQRVKNNIVASAVGQTMPSINSEILNSTSLFITTSYEEQQKIADFLSTVDEVIAQSEEEVRNLEQHKKAVMQKIFSQEVRFKRENGTSYPEWINTTFSETFSALSNNTFSRDMLSEDGTVFNIHYGDIIVKYGEVCDIQTTDIPKVNANIDTDKYDKLKDGDIIIADTGEDEIVGKAIEIYRIEANKVVSGLHTIACRPNIKFASKYLGYYINSPSYHNQLIPFMQGIKVTSIGRKNIADTVIYYPKSLEEQQKIADFLSACDETISYAKQELDKWKELKKGLLQQMFA